MAQPPQAAPVVTPQTAEAKPTTAPIHQMPQALSKPYTEQRQRPIPNKVSGISVSIRQPKPTQPTAATATATTKQEQPPQNEPFDETKLNFCWQQYVAAMPKEQTAMAKRMQIMRLNLRGGTQAEVEVNNEIVSKELAVLLPDVQACLQKELKNNQLNINIKMVVMQQEDLAVGPREKFGVMELKNPALRDLKNLFKLELS